MQAWIKTGFEGAEKPEDVPYEDFLEKGYYIAPTRDDWKSCRAVSSCSATIRKAIRCPRPPGLSSSTRRAWRNISLTTTSVSVPHYIPFGKRHQESLQCDRAKDYPYLLVSNHPRWRIHANMDDISWLREIPTCKVTGPDGYKYEPLWINPADAKGLGLESGDIAKLYNDRGWVLGGVIVTERIRPGVVYQDHGAQLDPIEPGVSDRGGANNLIAPTKTTSQNAPAK